MFLKEIYNMARVPKKKTKPNRKKPTKKPAKKTTSDKKKQAKSSALPSRNFDQELNAIYGSGDKKTDLGKLDKRRTSRLTRFLLGFIAVTVTLSAIAWAGFLIFDPWGSRSNESVQVTIEGPEEVTSGSQAEYVVRYENDGKLPVAALEIQLNLPETFIISEYSPTPTDELKTWTIGSLRPGSDGSITINGTIIGDVPSASTIQAIITYRPSNFNADFQDIETKEFMIKDTVLEAKFEGSMETVPGDEVEYVYRITNTGNQPAQKFEVYLKPQNTFLITEAEPALPENKEARWIFESLEPNTTTEIKLKGSYASEASGLQSLSMVSVFINASGIELTQTETTVQTDVLGGNLVAQTVINGQESDQSVELGDNLRVSIKYANQGTEDIGDASFELKLENSAGLALPIDFDNADLFGGSYDETSGTITWNNQSLPDLSLLEPDEQDVIDLTLPIVAEINPTLTGDSLTLTLTSSMQKIGSVISERSISSSPINININSDLNFSALSRFYDTEGNELGTGTIPPTVDETTSYRIELVITNNLHNLDEVEVSATLPLNVSWTGRHNSDMGELTFHPESRVVRWYVSNLPVSISELEASFEVSITPDQNDVGTFVKLVNPISVTATDTVTEEKISVSAGELTTESPNDEYLAGQGVVIE